MSDTPKSWGAAGVSVEFHRGETWKERAEALSKRLSFAEARIRELEAAVLAERSAAIADFCRRAGVSPSYQAAHIPDDVRNFRLDSAIRARTQADAPTQPEGGEDALNS